MEEMKESVTGRHMLVRDDELRADDSIQPTLVCVTGADLGKRWPVATGMTIGRGDVEIALGDGDVSRVHARLIVDDLTIVIEDLSRNGTLVNGEKLTAPRTLVPGDRVMLGNTLLLFTLHTEIEERAAAEQRLDALTLLASGIAHDFNNALVAVLGNLDLVADGLRSDATDASVAIDEMRAAMTGASTLAKRLLRLGRGGAPSSFEPIELEVLCRQAMAMSRHRARGVPIAFALEISPAHRVRGSFEDLQHMLVNLCVNAIDAMPNGGRITMRSRIVQRQVPAPGSYVELQITDTGHGMDAATLEHAFEPLFTTKPRELGTGLGLAMAHRTVRRHYGAIDAVSTPNAGTTFTIVLPCLRERTARSGRASTQLEYSR